MESFPPAMHLTSNNVTNWEHYLDDKLTAFPDVGQAIRNKTPFVLRKPTINDLFENTNVRMYNYQVDDPTALTDSSLSNFLKANAAFKKDDKDRRDEEAKVCHLILSSLSEDARMLLRSVQAFRKAVDDNDSYAMYSIAKQEHSRSSSFAVAQSIFQQILSVKLDGTFSKLVHDLTDHRRKFDAVFDKAATGTVRTDDIWVMILMNALPDDQFLFMKETMYSKDLKDAFPAYAVVLQDMQNYDLNRRKPASKPESTAPVGSTILSASSPNPAQTKCATCSKMFNTTMRKVGGGHYANCFQCSFKHREAKEAKAATAVNPTPAQVAGAQASLKKAQAVLLAASVAAKPSTDPVIPPPTQQDLNSINNYVESSYFSLTATTMDPTATPSDAPIIASFQLDSGSSLSVTKDLADLLQPVALPTPIPIISADGTTIHATHVGTSCLGTLIHYVPKSAVKLVSLGSLLASGYMAHTTKDRSIVITKPNGDILCSCPVQPNNTWIFPRQLMTGNPSTVVSTGISGTPGAIALPFRIPHEPRHFTKEEVKRATQARELHCFLSHPHNLALKSTLDHGHLSHHTHLTSQDIDLMESFFGSCTACTIGKLHNTDLHTTSLSPPSTTVGQCIFFDFQLLTTPSVGGNTQAIIAIDDRSGFLTVLGSKSKDHHDVMIPLEQLIATYNSRGHQVTSLCSDSEAICRSLATPLGLLRAHITHTTPDAHCHKVERAIQQIDQKVTAVLESLPYFLPTNLILYLKKYAADCINLTCSSTQHPASIPYVIFHRMKPLFNPDPSKALLPFGTVCLIKHTEGQRAALASKLNLNIHHVPKASVGVNLGYCHHHPGNNVFHSPPSTNPLIRSNFEIISLIPFGWKPKAVLQQTYIQNINPTYEDILLRDDYPQQNKAINQIGQPLNGPSADSAHIDQEIPTLLPSGPPTADFPVSDTMPATGPNQINPRRLPNLRSRPTLAQSPDLIPTPPPHRYPIHEHRIPSHLAYNLSAPPGSTKTSLSVSTSEQTEFSIKKGLLMPEYKHAVGPAIDKELTKMFVTYQALVLINKSDIPPGSSFFRFFLFLKLKFLPDHSFERMSARLCAMEMTPPPPDAATAYAATGDHHLFLLTVNAVLAAAIQGGYKDKVEFQRYDVPAAFLQVKLPVHAYGRLPPDVRPPYGGAYVKILRCIYGARVSNKIFDDDHTQLLLSLGYVQFEGDLRKFKITCPTDSTIFVIINTHVDDGGAILTWRSMYDKTLRALSDRYPGTLDSSAMDRYLGMGFSYNPDTGAMTASMKHSVIKILETFLTSDLPVQSTPYSMDLFDKSTDPTPVDQPSYLRLVGMAIWLLKLRFEIQLAVIMACTHNAEPTQGDLIKAIRLLAYLKGTPDLGPTWFTNEGPILIASCDAAFAVHPLTGGSQLSVSFRIGSDNAPFHVISKIQTTKISLNPTHSEYNAFSIATENIKFYRTYLAWLGYPQKDPTPLETDCAPAFSILLAPDFPKNSKNLLVQDRSVREAYRDKILTPVHVLSKGFATDLNAKPSGPTDFKAKRATLLNIAANPAFAKYL